MTEEPSEIDLEAVRETLKNAGLLPSERYLAAINAELAEKGLDASPQKVVCNKNYCVVVKPE